MSNRKLTGKGSLGILLTLAVFTTMLGFHNWSLDENTAKASIVVQDDQVNTVACDGTEMILLPTAYDGFVAFRYDHALNQWEPVNSEHNLTGSTKFAFNSYDFTPFSEGYDATTGQYIVEIEKPVECAWKCPAEPIDQAEISAVGDIIDDAYFTLEIWDTPNLAYLNVDLAINGTAVPLPNCIDNNNTCDEEAGTKEVIKGTSLERNTLDTTNASSGTETVTYMCTFSEFVLPSD